MKSWLYFLGCLVSFCSLAEVKFVKVKNFDVEHEIRGNGQHIVLLEAGGSSALSDWDPIFEALSEHATVIRYSRIGNGNSTKIKKNYSSEEYALEASLLLDALGIEQPVVFVAHSYGAYIARRFAATYQDRISGLVLIEPASEHDVDIMRKIDLALAEQQIAQVKLDDLANGMSNQYLDFWSKRPLPDFPQIPDIPVTVIASTKKYKDPELLFFTDQARLMWGQLHTDWANAFPRGKAVLTDKSYHYPQRDEPELVVTEIVDLLSRINR